MSPNAKFDQQAFHELCFYTLDHPDKAYFMHQHAVDAWQVQTATASTKPITVVFGLVGLYLFLEKGFTGRQVQLAHMQLAQHKTALPTVTVPPDCGSLTVHDVLETPDGPERDAMIRKWCASIWEGCAQCHYTIKDFLASMGY